MIVVSDTSPISNLLQISEIDLLRRIVNKIVIPTEVFAEICKIENLKEFLLKQDWIAAATLSLVARAETGTDRKLFRENKIKCRIKKSLW